MAPALLIYDAQVVLVSPRGERTLPIGEFWVGPGKTALENDEYLKAIQFPLPPDGAFGLYEKLGRSKMGDLAVVGVGILGFSDPDAAGKIRFRIGINSTAPTPYRVPGAEETLTLNPLSEEILTQAAEEAMELSAPIEDVRATALYQKKMVRNLTLKGLRQVWKELA
jgi:CO/xanthine dehydrogenase FAD-binding subunit